MLSQRFALFAVAALEALVRASAAASFHAFVEAGMPKQGHVLEGRTNKPSIVPSSDSPDARLAAMWVHQEELVDALGYQEHRARLEAALETQEEEGEDAPAPEAQELPFAPVQEQAALQQAPTAGLEWASAGDVLRTCAFLVALVTSAMTLWNHACEALQAKELVKSKTS